MTAAVRTWLKLSPATSPICAAVRAAMLNHSKNLIVDKKNLPTFLKLSIILSTQLSILANKRSFHFVAKGVFIMARGRSKSRATKTTSRAFGALARTFGIMTEVSPTDPQLEEEEEGVPSGPEIIAANKPSQQQVPSLPSIPETPGTEYPPSSPIPPKAKGFGRVKLHWLGSPPSIPAHTPSVVQLRESLSLRRLQLSLGSSLTSTDTRLLSVPIYRAGPGHLDHNHGPQNHPHQRSHHQGARRAGQDERHPSRHGVTRGPTNGASLRGGGLNHYAPHGHYSPSHGTHHRTPHRTAKINGKMVPNIGPHPGAIKGCRQYYFEHLIHRKMSKPGVDPVREEDLRLKGVQLIFELKQQVLLYVLFFLLAYSHTQTLTNVFLRPVKTYHAACVFYHRFRLKYIGSQHNWRDPALSCLFLACKTEDTLKKSREILCANYNMKNSDKKIPDDKVSSICRIVSWLHDLTSIAAI